MSRNEMKRGVFNLGFILLAPILFTFFCGPDSKSGEKTNDPYTREVQAWRALRLAELKKPDGWLSLSGLFWLQAGMNSFGGDPGNDVVFGGEGVPPRIGFFRFSGGEVHFLPVPGVRVTRGEVPVIEEITLQSDTGGSPTILSLGRYNWHIIRRGDRLGVRIKDARHPRIDRLRRIDAFPIDPVWRLDAILEIPESPRRIAIPTVLGTFEEQELAGILVFRLGGEEHRLSALRSGDDLFIIFADRTTGFETYGGGRFLNVDAPDAHGRTWIDFNRAINPPCVFSPFATCPLPPEGNRLNVRVTAGEKMVRDFHHP